MPLHQTPQLTDDLHKDPTVLLLLPLLLPLLLLLLFRLLPPSTTSAVRT
jgi:hypothetical protein